MIKTGSDFSGVGAFDQALKRLGISYETMFACDMDKFARQTYIHNYGEPAYYPENVYDREIPTESLDIYMTSPPCQSFSLAGKRKGEEDKRGVLFYNSHEFILQNNPKYFIFENVKGLLSDDNGNTFVKWVQLLGGKSVNGLPTLFPHPEAANYHLYWKVLNAKNYEIPQNRERVFLIGIRDDEDNTFTWPKELFLVKRLKDVLESDVDEKYYLSEEFLKYCYLHKDLHSSRGNGFAFETRNINEHAAAISTKAGSRQTDNFIEINKEEIQELQLVDAAIGAIRGRNPDNPKSRISGLETKQILEVNQNNTSNCLTTVQKDNVVVEQLSRGNNKGGFHNICPTITSSCWQDNHRLHSSMRIRKLTPRECFRLMDFPESFTWNVSDSQAYKQAGNSICVGVLAAIIGKLKLSIKITKSA